jgi:hypothetical protein
MYYCLTSFSIYPKTFCHVLFVFCFLSSTAFAQSDFEKDLALSIVPSESASGIDLKPNFSFHNEPLQHFLPKMSPPFELLLDETVRNNLGLKEKDKVELATRVKEIEQLWINGQGALLQFRKFKVADGLILVNQKTKQLEEFLQPKLTKKDLSYLKYVENLQPLLRIGVQHYFAVKAGEAKMDIGERDEFKKTLAELILVQHEKGNQLVYDFLDKAAPGLLEPFADDYGSLPKLPIKLLVMLMEKEDWCVSIEQYTLKQYGVNSLDGTISFSAWVFRLGADGELKLFRRGYSGITGMVYFLRYFGGKVLTFEQSSQMHKLIESDNDSALFDRNELDLKKKTELYLTRKTALTREHNKRLEEFLLPHQVRELEVLVRLHNICMFGVKQGVLSYLRSREMEVDHEKLNKSIETLHDALKQHCLETQKEIELLMLTVTAEDDPIGNLLFDRKSWEFDPELSPLHYELP